MHTEGTKPFLRLCARCSGVGIKYFKRIFFQEFQVRASHLAAYEYTNRDDSNNIQDISGTVHPFRCFVVYMWAVMLRASHRDTLSAEGPRRVNDSPHGPVNPSQIQFHSRVPSRIHDRMHSDARATPVGWTIVNRKC